MKKTKKKKIKSNMSLKIRGGGPLEFKVKYNDTGEESIICHRDLLDLRKKYNKNLKKNR